ncbi:MAG: HNH endonuclease, partial [Verrucomicrobiales bacterium]|nr:HNH endonuclease [Verrucomicrobiales bacterium]
LRRLDTRRRALDHVVPRVRLGGDSYRNVVASCVACNVSKNVMTAHAFVRRLYRKNLLNRIEFHQRLKALRALKQGHLKPVLESKGTWPH